MIAQTAGPAESSLVVDLAPYVVALVAVLGSTLVALLARRHTTQHWQRDERLSASAALLDAASRIDTLAIVARAARRRGAPDRDSEQKLIDLDPDLQSAVARLRVLGPDDLADAAEEVAATCQVGLDTPDDELDGKVVLMLRARTEFIDVARRRVTR